MTPSGPVMAHLPSSASRSTVSRCSSQSAALASSGGSLGDSTASSGTGPVARRCCSTASATGTSSGTISSSCTTVRIASEPALKPEPLPKMRRREGVTERFTTATFYRTTPRVRPTHVTSRRASLAAGAARARSWMESLVAGSHRYVVAMNARKDPVGRGMLGRNWPRAQEVSLTSCGADDDQPSSVSITALLASWSRCPPSSARQQIGRSLQSCPADAREQAKLEGGGQLGTA